MCRVRVGSSPLVMRKLQQCLGKLTLRPPCGVLPRAPLISSITSHASKGPGQRDDRRSTTRLSPGAPPMEGGRDTSQRVTCTWRRSGQSGVTAKDRLAYARWRPSRSLTHRHSLTRLDGGEDDVNSERPNPSSSLAQGRYHRAESGPPSHPSPVHNRQRHRAIRRGTE